MENCVFCDTSKISSEIQDYVDVIVFEPLDPVVPGHLLVVPKDHTADFTENKGISARVMEVAAEVAAKLGGDYNLITSKGRSATQSIMHLHIHLVPRREGDGLHLPWTDQKH
jgi:histidine triad (HIT) family protein